MNGIPVVTVSKFLLPLKAEIISLNRSFKLEICFGKLVNRSPSEDLGSYLGVVIPVDGVEFCKIRKHLYLEDMLYLIKRTTKTSLIP